VGVVFYVVAAVTSVAYLALLAARLAGLLRFSLADWITGRTNAQQRREINAWLLFAWLVPGLFIWLALRNLLWFVGWMSLTAMWATHWGALGTETPVELEETESVVKVESVVQTESVVAED
jgi:hypothetical protein